jgi:hypothetical protein
MLLNCNSRWRVSDPLARFARVSPSRGGDYFALSLSRKKDRKSFVFASPSSLLLCCWHRQLEILVRRRAAEGGRGSLTQYLELGRPWAESSEK